MTTNDVMTYLPWLLLTWLTLEAIWDLRNQDIPLWFSLVMLLPALALTFFLSPWTGLLVLSSAAATEIRSRWWRMAAVFLMAALVPIVDGRYLPLAVGWLLLALAWEAGWLGGADSLAGLSMLILYPEWTMLLAMAIEVLVWGLLVLLIRYGRQAGLRLWTVVSVRARGTVAAGIPAFVLAMIAYVALK